MASGSPLENMAKLLDGRRIRDIILGELTARVEALNWPPGLAVVLAGDDPASAIYVRNKVAACHQLGIYSEQHSPPSSVTTADLLALIASLNNRPEIDGILVQMPLPKQVDAHKVLSAVLPDKDVDGFHPVNVGNLVAGIRGPKPCTPSGIVELLKRYDIPMRGKRAVVVGRSNIVGKPMAMLLLQEDATVTICHSRTEDLAEECRRADILIAALGRPAFLTREYLRPGAVVVDVGINRIDPEQQKLIFGDRPARALVGDVDPIDVEELASAYTPVPGGVGPLTIAMLMANTVAAAEFRSL